MNRLTKGYEKHNNEYISYVADSSMYPEMMGYEQTQADIDAINKLGKLEDLEDELGCPLDVVFKALKEGIVVNDIMYLITDEKSSKTIFRKIIFTYNKFYKDYGFGFGMDENGDNPLWWISLKDYGKTWWLNEVLE